jgi:hypothetical protein
MHNRMKFVLIFLYFNIHVNLIFSQTQEEQSLTEFNSGKTKKYSTFGHGKSQGLKLHLKYPASWHSIDGERPNVERKFAQQDNYVLCILLIKVNEKNFIQKEINEFFTIEGLKESIPSGGQYLSCNTNLTIEKQKSGYINFTHSGRRNERTFYSYNRSYFIIYKKYFITMQFMVVNKIGEPNESVKKRFDTINPLFGSMFNSIVIDNVWE